MTDTNPEYNRKEPLAEDLTKKTERDGAILKYLICYRNYEPSTDGILGYEQISSENLNQWRQDHPDCAITHVFLSSSNIINYDTELKTTFLARCGDYGYRPEALNTDFIDSAGNRYQLLGMRTKNTKYKFVVLDVHTGKRFKITKEKMRSMAPVPRIRN